MGRSDDAGGSGERQRPRMEDRHLWVDTAIDQAMRRGEFDDLPYAGKPLPGIKPGAHDPDWWLKGLVEEFNARVVTERRQLTGGLPPVVISTRDVEAEVARWRDRRTPARPRTAPDPPPEPCPRARWFRRRRQP